MSTREKFVTWWWAGILLAVIALGTLNVFASGLDRQGGDGTGGGSGDANAVSNRLASYSTNDTYRQSAAPVAARFKTSTTTYVYGAYRTVRYKSTDYNTGGVTLNNGTTITVTTAGKYHVSVSNWWYGGAVDYKSVRLLINGTQSGYHVVGAASPTSSYISNIISDDFSIPANAVLKVQVNGAAVTSLCEDLRLAISSVNGGLANMTSLVVTANGAKTAITGTANAAGGIGIYGSSLLGTGVYGASGSGYAAQFFGKFYHTNGTAIFDKGATFNIKTATYGNTTTTGQSVLGSSVGAVDSRSATFSNKSGFLMTNNHGVRFRVFISASTIKVSPR
jgi:hypothetical protein